MKKEIIFIHLLFIYISASGQSDILHERLKKSIVTVEFTDNLIPLEESNIILSYKDNEDGEFIILDARNVNLKPNSEIEVYYVNGHSSVYDIGSTLRERAVEIWMPIDREEKQYLKETGLKYIKIDSKIIWLIEETVKQEIEKAKSILH